MYKGFQVLSFTDLHTPSKSHMRSIEHIMEIWKFLLGQPIFVAQNISLVELHYWCKCIPSFHVVKCNIALRNAIRMYKESTITKGEKINNVLWMNTFTLQSQPHLLVNQCVLHSWHLKVEGLRVMAIIYLIVSFTQSIKLCIVVIVTKVGT